MFSNTAYEALYKYLGLMFHSGSIEIITSEPFFKGLLLLLFGGLFLLTTWKFTARHIMGNLVKRYNVPLSQFVKIILCLVLGISILRIGSESQIKGYNGISWNENSYIQKRFGNANRDYKVSFIFDILSRTAEEISRYTAHAGEYIFGTESDSYLNGPHGYAKAIMLAGSATIEDPEIQKQINSYTRNCIMRVYSKVNKAENEHINLSGFYNGNSWINGMLDQIELSKTEFGSAFTCRDLKSNIRESLRRYTAKKKFYPTAGALENDPQARVSIANASMSSMLNNYYKDKKEGFWGVHKGSNPPGTAGTVFQYMNRFFSWDSFLSMISLGKWSNIHGASEAAERAQKFSELLARAPHIKGITQMVLIGIFPWLIFFVVAGKWKVITSWFWVYLSVCMWTPIWTIMYHVMNNISKSANVLSAYGSLSDGISLYSAELVLERIYYSYSVFTLAQTMVPFATTGMVLYFLRPILTETDSEHKPEFVDGAKNSASNIAGVATGLPIGSTGAKNGA